MAPFTPRRPSAAMVVSITALIVALGGTSYAAVKLPKNSVGSRQIKPHAVKASDIAKGAITSTTVKDRTLVSTDFKLGQLAAGPKGTTGLTGPSDVYVATSTNSTTNPETLTVDVPAGTYAVTAKALFRSNALANTAIECVLSPIDSLYGVGDYSETTLPTINTYATLANLGTKSFTAAGTFTYLCHNPTGVQGNFSMMSVIATKVGARH